MAQALASAREAAGISQSSLARAMGLTRKAVNQTERREREGLGIRDETRARYLDGLARCIERRQQEQVEAARGLIAAGLARLEEVELVG